MAKALNALYALLLWEKRKIAYTTFLVNKIFLFVQFATKIVQIAYVSKLCMT